MTASRALKTILLRVDAPPKGKRAYPVELFVQESDGTWPKKPLATSSIPGKLSPPKKLGLPQGTDTGDAIRALLVDEATKESHAFRAIGRYLYDLLFSGDVATEWAKLVEEASGKQGKPGRRLLLDIRPKALGRLPWELTWGETLLPLFADEPNPCVRVHNLSPPPERVACSPLRRVLVVLGVQPKEESVERDALDPKAETEELHEAFRTAYGLVDVKVLDRPLPAKIEEEIRAFRPHVFHFIGHGDSRNSVGELRIEGTGDAQGNRWTATAIATALNDWVPALAVINACRSQQGSEEDGEEAAKRLEASQTGTWEVAETFLAAGAQAVLAIQGDIRDDAAVCLSKGLYAAIAEGKPLDAALARARQTVAGANWDRRDPFLPCLTVTVPPEAVIPPQAVVKPKERQDIEQRFEPLRFLVDREEQRRDLLDFIATDSNGDADRRPAGALAIVGQRDAGKTGLLTWAMGVFALAGANVAYVNLRDRRADAEFRRDKIGFRAVLAGIAEQLRNAPVHGAANAEIVDALVARLGPDWATRPEDAVPAESIFAAFHEALNMLPPPVVLGLDHAETVQEAHQELVRTDLITAATNGRLNVRLLVAVNVANSERVLPAVASAPVPRVEVKYWPSDRYEELALRYLRAQNLERDVFERTVKALATVDRGDWPPRLLPGLIEQLTGVGTLSQ